MDAMNRGEAGVVAWCNAFRFSMVTDPGREDLENMVQRGLDFLDNYLDTVLSSSAEV